MHVTTEKKERVILCGIRLGETEKFFNQKMEECNRLCEACDMEVIAYFTQNLDSLDKRTAFGKGKLEELKTFCQTLEVDSLVFMNDLSFSIQKRLEENLKEVDIIDRTMLILSIFAKRARTKKAKIQTQMARLKYHLPKMLKHEQSSEDRNRSTGSHFSKGAGESRTSINRRKIEQQMHALRKELEELNRQNDIASKQRRKSKVKKVALVGYTNAGKSSLMNAILKATRPREEEVFAKDMLFATLDTSVRLVEYKQHEFFIFDTVGFVNDLPEPLVEAFKTTLEAVKEADILLHVIDPSHEQALFQREASRKTLEEIGAFNIPIIEVLNKVDICPEARLMRDFAKDAVFVSAKTKEGLTELLDRINVSLYPGENTAYYILPYDIYGKFYERSKVLNVHNKEFLTEGVKLLLSGAETDLNEFAIYKLDE